MDYQYIENFKKLGYGIFVHYGLYSLLGKGEWYYFNNPNPNYSLYKSLPKKFNVQKNFAKNLVSFAKKAGAKYITITARHHDGFSLYDTCGLSDFDVMHSACQRDLMAEFVNECKKQGIKPFFYHTLLDWSNPDYKKDFPKYLDYLMKSIELLCTKYGEIGGFWLDGGWDREDSDWMYDKLYQMIRKYQPNAMIINNTGLNELGKVSHKEIDSVTFERGSTCFVDQSDKPRAGEMCEVLNDTWGYAKNDVSYKSISYYISRLIDCRIHNCNFLLNVGLTSNGSIYLMDKAILLEIAKWIKFNKHFIYTVKQADITCSNGIVLTDGTHYYCIVNNVPMIADINVARQSKKTYAQLDTKSKKIIHFKWLDNHKSVPYEKNTNKFEITQFDYGISMINRVCVFEIQKENQ